ncbi:MAG: hypothetical protein Q9226_003351 [Calogaya cf. arnoldii]
MISHNGCQAGGTKKETSSQASISEERTGSSNRQGFAIHNLVQLDAEPPSRVKGVFVSTTNTEESTAATYGQQSSDLQAHHVFQQPVRASEGPASGFDIIIEDHAVEFASPHNIIQSPDTNSTPQLAPPLERSNQELKKIEAVMRDSGSFIPTGDDLRDFREGMLSEIDSAVKIWLGKSISKYPDLKEAVKYPSSMRLLKRMYSIGTSGLGDRITRLSQRCGAEVEVVLRGLVGTALSEWIFEAHDMFPTPEEDNGYAHAGSSERRSSLQILFQLRRQHMDQLKGGGM